MEVEKYDIEFLLFPSGGWLSNPLAVYKAVRPKDWMEIPDYSYEQYVGALIHVPQGETGYISFEAESIGQNGQFWRGLNSFGGGGGRQPTKAWAKYKKTIKPEEFNPQYLTDDGKFQYFLGVRPTVTDPERDDAGRIYGFRPATHPDITSPADFKSWNIVEIKARLPLVETFDVGSLFLTLPMLRFVTLIDGNGKRNVFIRF